jgi:DNA recombination protein RmuC
MPFILYLVTGLVLGVIIGYFIAKLTIIKNYSPRSAYYELSEENTKLKLENAGRLSKEDVSANFVHKELHETILSNLNTCKEEIKREKDANEGHQATILRLTGESNGKLSKEEVDNGYVGKGSFELIDRKLTAAETELAKNEGTILGLNKELKAFQEKDKFLEEKLTTFKDELDKLHKLSQEQFKNMATDIMTEKQHAFVETNKKEMAVILDPLKNDLSQFRQKVEDTRKEDIADLTSLKGEIAMLEKLNLQLSADANNLAMALKSEVKMQGNWGEDRLNMILESEGLQKYIDFTREEQYRDEEQEKNRKPDFILKLPNGKHIIIDSKVSLTAYINYFNADTPEQKSGFLKQHIRSIIDHIDSLADKNYQSLAGLTTPDYVFMFMPVESALTLAMNQNSEIFTAALKKKIVLITPTTLVATLKVVKILWQKENQVKNVEEIFRQCGELYNKFVTFLEQMDSIEAGLQAAMKAHHDAMYSLKDGTKKGNTIIGRFEMIRKLEARTNKLIPQKHISDFDIPDEENDVKILETGNEPGHPGEEANPGEE